jgi:HD-GYP domain-containing protein (c-di-GMP phosphodiesterase class II)
MLDRSLQKASGETREVLLEGALALLALMEEKDPFIRQHCERVANNCVHFCEKFSLVPPKDLDSVFFACLLHDLGLIFVPQEILLKPAEELNGEELRLFKQHASIGERVLSNLTILKNTVPLVRGHHERFDGAGYPDGRKGEDIPVGARLLYLFDRFDYMMFTRTLEPACTVGQALERILELAGTEFDPSLADQFAQFVEATDGVSRDYIKIQKKEEFSFKDLFAQILQRFASGKILPPVMPQVVQELQNAIRDPNATADSLSAVIEKDPVVCLRLISVANSPAFRGAKEIRSVRQAIPRLGLKETLNVVTAIANKSLYESKIVQFRLLLDKMWAHSLAAAYAAKLISQRAKKGEAETLFLMGLTHDIGKVFLLRALADEGAVRGQDMKRVLANVQEAHIGIGSMMLKRWGFDDAFIRAVSLHDKNELGPEASPEALIVNLANRISRSQGFRVSEAGRNEPAEPPCAEWLGLAPESVAEIGGEVKALVREMAHLC